MHMPNSYTLFHTLLYINYPMCIPFPLYIVIIRLTRHALFIVDSTAFVVNIPIEI